METQGYLPQHLLEISLTPINFGLMQQLIQMIDVSKKSRYNAVLFDEINPLNNNLLDYDEVVPRRLSFITIKKSLLSWQYIFIYEFIQDIFALYQYQIQYAQYLSNNESVQQIQQAKEYFMALLQGFFQLPSDEIEKIGNFNFDLLDLSYALTVQQLEDMCLIQYMSQDIQEQILKKHNLNKHNIQDIKVINLICMQHLQQKP